MNREELLKTLRLAAPALLSDSDAVLPILKSVKFTGSHVIASNDVIAICLAIPVTEEGIVPGRKLISFLSACNSKNAKVTKSKKGNLLVKCASAQLRLSVQPEDEWPFDFPDIEQAETMPVNEAFFEALERCSAQSPDTGLGSWAGGIIFLIGTVFGVYGTGQSRATIAYCRVEGIKSRKKETDLRVVVPSSFCKAAVTIARTLGTEAVLHVTEDSAVLDWDEGENVISTKLIQVDMPDVVGRFLGATKDAGGDAILIKPALADALQRAVVIGDLGTCRVTHEEDGLRLRARGSGAVLNELVKFTKDEVVPDVDQLIAAGLICKWLNECTEISFGEKATVLRSESGLFTYVVATRVETKK